MSIGKLEGSIRLVGLPGHPNQPISGSDFVAARFVSGISLSVVVSDGMSRIREQFLAAACHLPNNFHLIVLPAGVLDQEVKGLWLAGRTLVTDKPEELAIDDVPVLEFSLMDITEVKADEGAIADMISSVWTKFRLKTEGWFVLRLRPDGKHQIEFPQ
jgi:hypothetical protein